jgi:hypothetical protein
MKTILVTATMTHFSLFGVRLWHKPAYHAATRENQIVSQAHSVARLRNMRKFPVLHLNCDCQLKQMDEDHSPVFFGYKSIRED